MKKKVIVICAVLCVLGLGAGAVYAAVNSKANDMFLAGQLFQSKREAQDPNRGEQAAATYHEHIITVETVEYQKEMNLLRSAEAAASYQTDRDVIDRIVESIILTEEAERLGLSATEEEIDEMVEDAREAYALPDGKELLDAYCEGAGITIEDYYDLLREQAPGVIARQKLKNEIGKQYCQEHQLEYNHGNPPEGMLEAEEDYINRLLEEHKDEIEYFI